VQRKMLLEENIRRCQHNLSGNIVRTHRERDQRGASVLAPLADGAENSAVSGSLTRLLTTRPDRRWRSAGFPRSVCRGAEPGGRWSQSKRRDPALYLGVSATRFGSVA
jgi:hypothetical protein